MVEWQALVRDAVNMMDAKKGVRFVEIDRYCKERHPCDYTQASVREAFKSAKQAGELIDQVGAKSGPCNNPSMCSSNAGTQLQGDGYFKVKETTQVVAAAAAGATFLVQQ